MCVEARIDSGGVVVVGLTELLELTVAFAQRSQSTSLLLFFGEGNGSNTNRFVFKV